MEKLIVLQKDVNAKLFSTYQLMEPMILNAFASILLRNMIETIKCVKDKNAQDVKVLQVLGLVHVGNDIKNMLQYLKLSKKGKNKINH